MYGSSCTVSGSQRSRFWARERGIILALIDGYSYIFRAYHALPKLTRASDGAPVGALAGYCNMLYKIVSRSTQGRGNTEPAPKSNASAVGRKATHLAVIFDPPGDTFRSQIYPDYKAHRPPAPEDLVPQFDYIRRATEAFSVASVEVPRYEADDVIATLTKIARACGATVDLYTGDKDLMQLVGDGVLIMDAMKGKVIDTEAVHAKFGVLPNLVGDALALAGDSADNIPGVTGIGLKTAALLLETYGDLETLLDRAHEIKQTKRRENLIAEADLARLSRQLVALCDGDADCAC